MSQLFKLSGTLPEDLVDVLKTCNIHVSLLFGSGLSGYPSGIRLGLRRDSSGTRPENIPDFADVLKTCNCLHNLVLAARIPVHSSGTYPGDVLDFVDTRFLGLSRLDTCPGFVQGLVQTCFSFIVCLCQGSGSCQHSRNESGEKGTLPEI